MKMLSLVFATALLLTGCSSSTISYRQISMQEAADRMQKEKNYILLDVRTLEEFSETHIPGAICVPNETIGSEDIPLLPDKEQLIFVYCRSGNRSKEAAQKLADLGYTNIVEIGGIKDWTGETYPHEGCSIPTKP